MQKMYEFDRNMNFASFNFITTQNLAGHKKLQNTFKKKFDFS